MPHTTFGSNLEPEFTYKQTNVSRPRLSHSASKQSITASEDYYSLASRSESSVGSDDHERRLRHSQNTAIGGLEDDENSHLLPTLERAQSHSHNNRFSTPPSRFYTPSDDDVTVRPLRSTVSIVAPDALPHQPEFALLHSLPPTVSRSQSHSHSSSSSSSHKLRASPQVPAPAAIRSSYDSQRARQRAPIASHPQHSRVIERFEQEVEEQEKQREHEAALRGARKMADIKRLTTPGVDDSPYIRFAIDQLTRDEEVRGTRHFPEPKTERISQQPPVPALPTGYQARRAESRPESLAIEESRRDSYPVDRMVNDEGLGYMAQEKEMRARTPFGHPALSPTHTKSERPDSTRIAPEQDVFMPYHPQLPTERYPELRYLPTILRPAPLAGFTLLCTLMFAGLVFCAVWSSKNNGLAAYDGFGNGVYFVFKYLPSLLGVFLLVWLMQIESAVQRIAPFIGLAANSTAARSQASFLDLYPTNFIFPKLQYWRAGQPFLAAIMAAFWLFLLSVPLLAASFNVHYFEGPEWRWMAVYGVIWTCVALYALVIVASVALLVYLQTNPNGLKQDCRSLADIVSLLQHSNIMADYAETETLQSRKQFQQRLWARTDRLGYWHTSKRHNTIFYGLGEEGKGATKRYSLDQGRMREKISPTHSRHTSLSDLRNMDPKPHSEGAGTRLDLRHQALHRHTPWALRSPALLAFMLIAVVLLVAFLVVSFVHRASTAGFFPGLRASSDASGFAPAAFLYSFLPSLLGLLIFLIWQPLDFTVRRLAPYTALTESTGATADKSLLLEYPALFAPTCSVRAVLNRDWLVALTSILTFVAPVLPIIAGGVFWAQWYAETSAVRVSADLAGWYALCFFLALQAAGFVALFAVGAINAGSGVVPALPHEARCLAEVISWLYMSPLVTDPEFTQSKTREDMIQALLRRDIFTRSKRGNGKARTGNPHTEPAYQPQPGDEDDDLYSSNTVESHHPPRLGDRLIGRSQPYTYTSLSNPLQRTPSNYSYSSSDAPHNRIATTTLYMPPTNPAAAAVPSPAVSMAPTRPLSPLRSRDGPPRFAWGIYIGRDGREHLGIDRTVRGGREMVAVGRGGGDWLWR